MWFLHIQLHKEVKGNGGLIASANLLKRKLLVVVWAAAALTITKSANCSGENVHHLFPQICWENQQQLSPQSLLKREHHLLSVWCCTFHPFFHRLHGWVFLMAPGGVVLTTWSGQTDAVSLCLTHSAGQRSHHKPLPCWEVVGGGVMAVMVVMVW